MGKYGRTAPRITSNPRTTPTDTCLWAATRGLRDQELSAGCGGCAVRNLPSSILGGLALLFGGVFLGGLGAETGDDEVTGAGAVVAAIGLLILLIGAVGIWAGVLMAQRRNGVYIAWGTLAGRCPQHSFDDSKGMAPDIFTLGCNGICALLVGLPLMISSASQHME